MLFFEPEVTKACICTFDSFRCLLRRNFTERQLSFSHTDISETAAPATDERTVEARRIKDEDSILSSAEIAWKITVHARTLPSV